MIFCFELILGKLSKAAVLKAICASFQETTEPSICLTPGPYFLPFLFFFSPLTCILEHPRG